MDSLDILSKLDELSHHRKRIIRSIDTRSLHLTINKTQEQVLMAILKTPENNMTDLSQQIGLEKSSLTRTIDSLIYEGLVARAYGIQDRRTITLTLTEKGLVIAHKIDRIMRKYFEDILAGLSENEKNELYTHLSITVDLLMKCSDSLREKRTSL